MDEADEPDDCPICGHEREWESCWHCHGEGGFHDCGEDCCPCLDAEGDLNETCEGCNGHGGYLVCRGPHPTGPIGEGEFGPHHTLKPKA